ncbi:MAG TPA: MarR family transcriptional regulator [Conexibacter sp.]|jgi:DNA-binding MarR family transcriptional regulator
MTPAAATEPRPAPGAEQVGAGTGATPAASAPAASAAGAREQLDGDIRAAFTELLAAERRLRSRKSEREGSLSYSQVRALFVLEREERATAGQLAKAAELTPGTVTALLDQLEREGMVERTRSTDDRRLVFVSLTPAGQAELAQKRARWTSMWEDAMGDVSDAELKTTRDVMRRMVRVLDTL